MPDWRQAWVEGHTPWDAGASAPALLGLLRDGHVPAGRILVPGCGTGYDLATLARADRTVVGLDLSPLARDAFAARYPELPGEVRYEVEDFFGFTDSASFDFVWDYTFFCALEPERRNDWGAAMRRLVRPGGTLATLLFPYAKPMDASECSGPPWPIDEELVGAALGDAFERMRLDEVPHSHPGRGGKERLALWKRTQGAGSSDASA